MSGINQSFILLPRVDEKELVKISTLHVIDSKYDGFFGKPFKAGRRVLQGGPVSPWIFNVMVDDIVREWLRQVLGEEVACSGIGADI